MNSKLVLIFAGLCCAGVALAEGTELSPAEAAAALPDKYQKSLDQTKLAKDFSYGMGQMAKAGGWAKLGMGAARAAGDLAGAWKPLSDVDKSIGNQLAGGPKVPSQCVAGSGCSGCFEKAQGDLYTVRFALAKLGAIGKWTDTFTKKSIAFGDSASGVHGVAGIAWQAERSKIEASYSNFGVQYDNKYQELIGQLQTALRDVGQCEGKYFQNGDWYDRYGYIYYSFMADRYRR